MEEGDRRGGCSDEKNLMAIVGFEGGGRSLKLRKLGRARMSLSILVSKMKYF